MPKSPGDFSPESVEQTMSPESEEKIAAAFGFLKENFPPLIDKALAEGELAQRGRAWMIDKMDEYAKEHGLSDDEREAAFRRWNELVPDTDVVEMYRKEGSVDWKSFGL